MRHAVPFTMLLLAAVAAACGRADDTAPPVAAPSVSVAREQVSVGSPLQMHYQFVVAPDAPAFADDYWVFVHFLDADGELMWTDDHQPPTPTRQWKPGQTVEYQRTMFVPKFPYTGPTVVELGVFSRETNQRIPLSGESSGQRAYRVATFELTPPTEGQFVIFKNGWHATEVGDDEIGTEWQWSKKESTLAFRNPRRDATIYVQVDQPVKALSEPQTVDVRIGDTVVESFQLPAGTAELRKFPVSAAQLGATETVEITLVIDRTFVPANTPGLNNSDVRELGIRVFRAFVEAR